MNICGYMRMKLINYHVYTTHDVFRTAFDKISYDLGQKVDAVTSELKIVSESLAMNGNPAVPTSGPSAASSISLFALLSKSKLLPRLDPEDYEGVGHWYPGTYRKLRRKLKSSGAEEEEAENELPGLGTGSTNLVQASVTRKDPVLSRFLEDKDGNPILEGQKKAILATAASFWQYLLDNKRAPKTFRKVNIEVKLQWQVLMESNYECLRYCDSHWKVDQVWINYYPSWLKTAKRKLAEEERGKKGKNVGGVIDIDTDDADELVGSDENDENEDSGEDGDQDTELLNANNKRGPTDSSNTDRSKRPRVEEPETPAARPRPQPKRVSANHPKVRTHPRLVIYTANNVQANPLYKIFKYARARFSPLTSMQGTCSRNPGHSTNSCSRSEYFWGRPDVLFDSHPSQNAPGTAGNETPPTSGAPPSGTSSGSSESLDTRPVSDSAPRISADNSMPRVAPAPGPLSSPPSVLPPTPPSSGTSSGSLESPPGRLSSGPPPSDSAVNLTSQIAPASGPTSSASSAPPSAPSQGDSQNGPPAVDSAAATSLGTAPPQNTSLGTSAMTTTASTSQPRSTSDPTPAIALTDTTGTQGTSNKKSTSKKSAPGKGSRKAAPKKDPKPKKMVLSK